MAMICVSHVAEVVGGTMNWVFYSGEQAGEALAR